MRMLPNSRQPVSNFCNIFIFYTIRQENLSFEWLSPIASKAAEAGDKVAVAYTKEEPPAPPAATNPKEPTPAENPNRPANLTGYDALAWDIIDNIGGKEKRP